MTCSGIAASSASRLHPIAQCGRCNATNTEVPLSNCRLSAADSPLPNPLFEMMKARRSPAFRILLSWLLPAFMWFFVGRGTALTAVLFPVPHHFTLRRFVRSQGMDAALKQMFPLSTDRVIWKLAALNDSGFGPPRLSKSAGTFGNHLLSPIEGA